MCVVGATAIIGAAVVGAAGTAIAGHEAAQATKGATNAAIAQQNKALSEQAQLSAPYRALGQAGIPKLEQLLGLSKGGNPQAALASMPGYQFAKQQGLQGVTNQASAMGLGLSGNTLEGLQKFGTGLADQTYQQEVGNLENVVGMGQAAAAGQAQNVGQAGGNISSALINQGNTMAGIDANTVAGITKSIGGGIDNAVLMNTLQGLGGGGGGGSASLAGVYGPSTTAAAMQEQGLYQIPPVS
jgi:hypothetical protein